MGELKRITTKRSSLFTVKVRDKSFTNCTIETLDGRKYGVLDSKGKLVLVIRLNAKEIKGLYRNGSINNRKLSIEPMDKDTE